MAHKILLLRCLNELSWLLHITVHTFPYINPILWLLAFFLDFWHTKMGPMGRPETSVSKYHQSLQNNPEERNPRLIRVEACNDAI
jgi:hypothetical protein